MEEKYKERKIKEEKRRQDYLKRNVKEWGRE